MLQQTISGIQVATWELINRVLLQEAKDEKVDRGERLRIDSAVTETHIHAPSDSTLLWDSVRVMVRLLEAARSMPCTPAIAFRNHRRRTKKRARGILYTRGQ
jgi:IS5 family transposase